MIMVDVYVPSLGQSYDFSLDETAKAGDVTEELADMIAQKEQCELKGPARNLILCSDTDRKPLPAGRTLGECGIRTGHRLLLV
ncbi:MAG: EsaB/YukD family protein [Lachnospiraceae bacterium]|nr:EsaB/YukD family protein [Lachnospiraceae bacterium]